MADSQLLLSLLALLSLTAQPQKLDHMSSMLMGKGLDRQPHAYASGSSPGQGQQTLIGLESIWTFDDSTYRDWKGTNDLLVSNGSPVFATGKVSGGVNLGTGSKIRTTTIPPIVGPVSYAIWIRCNTVTSQQTIFSHNDEVLFQINANPDAGADAFTFQGIVSLGAFSFLGGFVFDDTPAANLVIMRTGEWHFIGISIDPSNAVALLCVDNKFRSVALSSFPIATQAQFSLGSDIGFTAPFQGLIDEPAFWRRALSVNDFVFLRNNGLGQRYPWDQGRLLIQMGVDTWFYGPDDKYIETR